MGTTQQLWFHRIEVYLFYQYSRKKEEIIFLGKH